MNANEFYSEFNLVYNNLSSNQAAGLDKYEIGVYLTKAQSVIVDSIYAEFEKSEAARRKLANIVVTAKLNTINIPEAEIIYPQYTTTFKPLSDIRYIINEQVKMSNKADVCIRDTFLSVQPIVHDEIDNVIKNPYRFNLRRALRLDAASDGNNYIEILTKDKNIAYYQIRYVKNPEPIILEDLTGNDSIDGKQEASLGSLPEETHRQIVEIAAKMAYQDYKS